MFDRASSCRITGALSAGIASLMLIVAPAATADQKRLFKPVRATQKALHFQLHDVAAKEIRGGRLSMRPPVGERLRLRRTVSVLRLREAISDGGKLRVKRPNRGRGGVLAVTLRHSDSVQPPVEQGPCAFALEPGANCELLFEDSAATSDVNGVWGSIECASASRQTMSADAGDPGATAFGETQAGPGYRSLQVIDGDDFYGERCELGRNDHRSSPTAVYEEGQRRVTYASFRLPANFPIDTPSWQVVMQMKQSQPAANGGGTPVLSLEVRDGRWRLMQSTSAGASSDTLELWSAPATSGAWVRFAVDGVYSQDPSKGTIKISADLNADGDVADVSEQSETFRTYTLKTETEGGSASDGIAPGESIPSHLRVGLYHNPTISCPPPAGCSIDVDNVQVLAAS